MKASDLMTSFVVAVRADATIEYAAQLMLQYRISGLPVTDSDGAVLGIITESDLLRRAETGTENRHARWASLLIAPGRLAQEYVRAHGCKVAEVMTERVFIVTPETPLADLVALMETKHVKRVPVVDQGRLVGIVPGERERAALCVAAENVPGVKAVHDRLVWIDSVSGIVIPRP